MTEIATYTPAAALSPRAAIEDYQTKAVQRLGEWAQSADAAFGIAQRLVESSFVPASFKNKPVEAAAAILAGSEVGLSPMAALRSFDVIQGQAAPRAITLRAIVQSFGHEMILVESTATRCRMRGRRRGNEQWQDVTWTIDRARDLALLGKDNWKKQPQAMLLARATSELARLIAADAILGIGYTAEEVEDGTDATVTAPPVAQEEPASGTRKMSRRKPVEAVEPEPVDVTDAEVIEDEPQEPPITDAQMKALHASFNDHGITDRDERLAYCTEVTQRDLTSSKDLTKEEASRLIDLLNDAPVDTLPMGGE